MVNKKGRKKLVGISLLAEIDFDCRSFPTAGMSVKVGGE